MVSDYEDLQDLHNYDAHILLVDDNAATLKLVEMALLDDNENYYIAKAKTFKNAINFLNSGVDYQLIVLDVNLGDGTCGLDLNEHIARHQSQAAVLVLTSDESEAVTDRAKALNYPLLHKPFDLEVFISQVNKALSQS